MSNITGTLAYVEPIGCALALLFMLRAKEHRTFGALTIVLSVRLFIDLAGVSLLEASSYSLVAPTTTYPIYFYLYWVEFVVETVLSFYMILSVFRLAMAPLQGLRTLGMLVFRWAAAISTALAIALSFSPSKSAAELLPRFLAQFQEISSVITICLLLFVCFSIKPLGLTLRSRIFGVSLGLGLTAWANLMQSAWFAPTGDIHAWVNAVAGLGNCFGILIWTAYFAMPEPKRRIIVLPTTSPFLRWNQISEVLGDDPGFVAIAGIPPELFAPAEIEVMIRASIKMKELEEFDPEANAITLSSLSA